MGKVCYSVTMTSPKLTNRAEFARIAGVSAAAITKACASVLKPAVRGKRIDENHPAAKAYIKNQEVGEIRATGFDPLYEDAVIFCRSIDRYSIRTVRTQFKVGSVRAKIIVDLMKAAGVVPKPGELPPKIEPPKPTAQRVIKGHTKRNETKKSESLANLENGKTLHEIPADIEKFADMTLRELIERFGSDVAFLDWLKATKSIEDINEKRLKNAQTRGELVNREVIKRGVIEPINNAHIQLLTDGSKTLARMVTTLHASGETVEDIEKFIVDHISSFIKPVKAKIAKALRNA